MNLLPVLDPLVKATFGYAKFLASSIFVAAVLVLVLEKRAASDRNVASLTFDLNPAGGVEKGGVERKI